MSIDALAATLNHQTASILDDLSTCSVAVLKLRLSKANHNLAVLRRKLQESSSQAVDQDETVLRLQDRLTSVQYHIWKTEKQVEAPLRETAPAQAANDTAQLDLLSELNQLPDSGRDQQDNKNQLRQRRNGPIDKLEVQDEMQRDLSEDILQMVRQIKQNAETFSRKMADDNAVVDSASEAIARAAGKMDSVGSSLSKYRRSGALGWWFYIWATVFMIAALVGSMIIVQIFPKW